MRESTNLNILKFFNMINFNVGKNVKKEELLFNANVAINLYNYFGEKLVIILKIGSLYTLGLFHLIQGNVRRWAKGDM